jgi:hypothetical protein
MGTHTPLDQQRSSFHGLHLFNIVGYDRDEIRPKWKPRVGQALAEASP